VPSAACDRSIQLPDGFCATIFADSVGHARDIVVADNGDVYIDLENGGKGAAVVALRDTTHDGRADVVEKFGTRGGTGIGLYRGSLYTDAGDRILRYALQPGRLAPTGSPETVIDRIPTMPGHAARNFVIDSGSGTLILNIGSATNSCQKEDRTLRSPGVDPCRELDTRAGLWRFEASKTGQQPTIASRFATGIRNGMGLAYEPTTHQLYATQHGRDQLHDNWPDRFTVQQSAELPAEELMAVNQGDDFGWPYCYFDGTQKKLVLAPEYGGDGTKTGRCDAKKAPLAWYPGHWAPMSLVFYTGSQFPAHYKNGAFIAFHGSWNRAPEPQQGYRVVFQPFSGGKPSGQYETFANGFAGANVNPSGAVHRPVGLAQGPDGALYITDDKGGRVWRVTYGASR
jgi:glucose/arabinose dehydrogenase